MMRRRARPGGTSGSRDGSIGRRAHSLSFTATKGDIHWALSNSGTAMMHNSSWSSDVATPSVS